MVVKASFSDEAANTVIDPDIDADAVADAVADADAYAIGDAELPELPLDPQPATADAVIPAAMRVMAVRRIAHS